MASADFCAPPTFSTPSAFSTPPTSARGPPSSPPPAPLKSPLVRVVVIDPFQRTARFATLPVRTPAFLDEGSVVDRLSYDLFDSDACHEPPPVTPYVDTLVLKDEPVEDHFMEIKAHAFAFPDHAPDLRLPGFMMCGVAIWGKAVLFRHYTRTGTVESMAATDVPPLGWLPPRALPAAS